MNDSMILKESPDHHDADLVLKLYDLRREAVMRESRNAINSRYWPKSTEEALAVLQPSHPLNGPFRQTGGYWEMVYGMARHGIVHTEFLVENSGEGLFLFARVQPFLAAIRENANPRAFTNAEWIVSHSPLAQSLLEMFRARVAKQHAQG